MVYTINKALVGVFESKLATFAKKFNKYGYGEISYSKSSPYTVERKDDNGRVFLESVVDIDIDASYKINDYEFIATLEFDTEVGENIIRKANDDVQVPVMYRKRTSCDHCKTNRMRLHTILLRNTKSGEFIQVGKSCVKDYLGVDIGNYASYLSFYNDVEEMSRDIYVGARLAREYGVKDILLQTIESVKHNGYVSKQSAYDNNTDSTSSRVWLAINEVKDRKGELLYERYETSNETAEYLEKVIAFLNDYDDTNDYVHNLKNLAKKSSIESSDFGMVVSTIGWYLREINKDKERKERQHSEWVGEVGQRITFTATPKCLFSTSTEFGWFYIYSFEVDGNQIIWKTSKDLEEKEITLIGTIKELNMRNGIKQTEVTRCRVAK